MATNCEAFVRRFINDCTPHWTRFQGGEGSPIGFIVQTRYRKLKRTQRCSNMKIEISHIFKFVGSLTFKMTGNSHVDADAGEDATEADHSRASGNSCLESANMTEDMFRSSLIKTAFIEGTCRLTCHRAPRLLWFAFLPQVESHGHAL